MGTVKRTGVVRDPRYADHCPGPDCPECSQRQTVLDDMLNEPNMHGHFQPITPRRAEKEELLQIHTPKYIRRLEETRGQACTYLGPDTQTSPFSYEAALLAAGGLCRAIELVHAGQLDNAIARYQQAIGISPDLFAAHYNLGTLLLGRGDLAALPRERRAVGARGGDLRLDIAGQP